jgi:hypothetical protein
MSYLYNCLFDSIALSFGLKLQQNAAIILLNLLFCFNNGQYGYKLKYSTINYYLSLLLL